MNHITIVQTEFNTQEINNLYSAIIVKEGYAVGECEGQIVLAEITQRTDGNYDERAIWYIGRNVAYADLETLAEVVTHLLKQITLWEVLSDLKILEPKNQETEFDCIILDPTKPITKGK